MADRELASTPEGENAEPIPVFADIEGTASEEERAAADERRAKEEAGPIGAVAVRFLADRIAGHVAEMRPGLEEVKEAVFESFDKSTARSDLARRHRMGMLFAQTAAVETAVREFAVTLAEAGKAEPEAAHRFVRMQANLDEFARIDAEASRKLRLLASNAHEPWADEREDVSPWEGPHVPGVLVGQFLEDAVKSIAHLAESVRKRRMETQLIEALAALDAELLRQKLELETELDAIRGEREAKERFDGPDAGSAPTTEAAAPDSPLPGAPEAFDAWKSARLVANGAFATESDRLKADAAAWAAIRVAGPDEFPRLAGPEANEAETAARRYAERAATERGLAPSRVLLAGYEKAMAESLAAERAALNGEPSPETSALRARLRDQAREQLAAYLELRAGRGGDGMDAAATSHALLRGIPKTDAKAELEALLVEAPIARDRSLDVAATARQAHAGVMPIELLDASLEREFRRSAENRRRRMETIPRRDVVVTRHRELERARDEWEGLRSRGGAVGAWAAWKAEALSRELRAGAARMMAEPEMIRYLDHLATQGGAKSVALRSGVEALAREHVAEAEAEASLAPDQKLVARWMTLDLARSASEGLIAEIDAGTPLRGDLVASVAKDARALTRQCRETADAITRSERIESMVADFEASVPNDETLDAMIDRLADDAIAARANVAERGRADVEALLDPSNPTVRGRTSAHVEANLAALLRDGDPVRVTGDAFSVSAHDAEAKTRDQQLDLGISLPEPRRAKAETPGTPADVPMREGNSAEKFVEGASVVIDPRKGRSEVAFERTVAAEVLAAEREGRGVEREKEGLVIDLERVSEKARPVSKEEAERKADEKRRDTEDRKRETAIARSAAALVSNELRLARVHRDRQRASVQSSDKLLGLWQGNAAAGLWNAGVRTKDKLLVIGSEVGEAMRNRDRSVGTFAGFAKSWREIEERRAKIHLRTLEETLRRVADGKATEGDLRNLNAYARSTELRMAVTRGERLEGRSPEMEKVLKLARKRETDRDLSKIMRQASESLAEVSIERFAKAMDRGRAAFVADCGASGEFERDYVPTKEEIRLARAIASDSRAMEKLLDRKEKLDGLRTVTPGKSNEELEKLHFKRGRTAKEGLKAERLLALVDLAITREIAGVVRGEKDAPSIRERTAKTASGREAPVGSRDDRWLDQARRLDAARKGMDVAGGEIRYPSVADLFKGHADKAREARDQGRGRERDVER